MLIDFHTHAFADSIAERAVHKLKETAKIENYTNGTVGDLKIKLTEWNVDFGVLLPIATKPSQQIAINNWAAEINGGNIISFGTINPFADNIFDEIQRIKTLGLKGIKLHPAYQGVYLFDEKMKPIFKRAEELDLPVTIHMGYDPVCPFERHAMPYHLLEITERFPRLVIIAAHMGGMCAWEEVCRYVCGNKSIYLDTAFTHGILDKELMHRIIKKHGADKILFGSDLPWHNPLMELETVCSLPLTNYEREKILYKNAAELLKL